MKIEIKKELANELQKRDDQGEEFKNVEEYVNYVLGQVVEKLTNKTQEEPAMSKEDEEEVKKRLKALGYLD